LPKPPLFERIVCLSPDLVNTVCTLGCAARIVGKPLEADLPGTEKAELLGYFARTSDTGKIAELKPDLVIGFSHTCAKAISRLIESNINVLALQYSNLFEIYRAMRLLGRVLGKPAEAEGLVATMQDELKAIADESATSGARPKIYFEEWNKPLVCGLEWISEIMSIAGGVDVFADRCQPKKFNERIVTTEDIVAAAPDIMLVSWCGKPLDIDSIKSREGWQNIPAVANVRIYEVPGDIILRPGLPLIEGARFIRKIIKGESK
jgi:iron complex transport system substrate-binding protein